MSVSYPPLTDQIFSLKRSNASRLYFSNMYDANQAVVHVLSYGLG